MNSSLSSRLTIREDLVVVEQVVADRELAEEIGLAERHLLTMAAEKVEELSLQRRARTIGVEVGEKRIVGFFEDDGRVEAGAEAFGECGLADADRSFDRDVAKLQGGPDDIIATRHCTPRARHARESREARMRRSAILLALVISAARCGSAPPAPPKPLGPTFEQKMAWILRLEDQRRLRDPEPPPAPLPPVATAPVRGKAGKAAPVAAPVAPPSVPDLVRLLVDEEARVRRRAALAIGRVGMSDGVQPLVALLGDADPEVRQMAAFALGLLGDASARDALVRALADSSALVQSSAVEALGLIGDAGAADAIGEVVAQVVRSGALDTVPGDEMDARRDTPVGVCRLGIFALARLKAFPQLAAAVLDASGQPRVKWWPVAYALQRLEDPRGLNALVAFTGDERRFTKLLAIKGLAALKTAAAVPVLVTFISNPDRILAIEAVKGIGRIGDATGVQPLLALIRDRVVDPVLRGEATAALGRIRAPGVNDLLLDLLSDRQAEVRASALSSLATLSSDDFVTVLSGLDPDSDWSVRAALATVLGTLSPDLGLPRLRMMLSDSDQRVIPAVLASLVKLKDPSATRLLIDRLTADDPGVRAAAARAIAEIKPAGGAAALTDAYAFGIRDTTYVARTAALDALTAYGAADAKPVLDMALADKDWAVRIRAAKLLQRIDPTSDALQRIRPAPTRLMPDAYASSRLIAPPVSTHVFIETDRGTIEIELAMLDAPLTVDNFITLARNGFFDGLSVHRIVPGYVVQMGDPRGDDEGGPGYTIRDELNELPYLRGTVGMALDWEDTGGSQFFVAYSPQPQLDAKYTAFGRVVAGMDAAETIQQGDVIRHVRVWDGQGPAQ